MIPTSAVFRGTARITITGLLTVSFFKKAAVDHAAQVIHTADKVTIVTIGLAAADLCLSTAILLLASDRTARKIISGDFSQSKESSPSLPSSDNTPDTLSPPTSPLMDSIPYITPFTGTTPVPRQKRLSMESHTTLVADDDDNNNNSSDSGFFVNESKKPPDTERILKRRQQQHRVRLRAARARSYIGHLEQLHGEILVDQMALVDGWADAMAKLGLTSMLSAPDITCTH